MMAVLVVFFSKSLRTSNEVYKQGYCRDPKGMSCFVSNLVFFPDYYKQTNRWYFPTLYWSFDLMHCGVKIIVATYFESHRAICSGRSIAFSVAVIIEKSRYETGNIFST